MSSNTERLVSLIRLISFSQRDAADQWVKGTGLTPQQSFALNFIQMNQEHGVIAREIADITGTTPASVTSLLKGLEERGLIERTPSPTDSRAKVIRASAKGLGLTDGFAEALIESQRRLFAVLDDDEQAQLVALLERVAVQIDVPEDERRRGGAPEREGHRPS
ncbi:MarR family winged helix-turn-helix transcriptional regulator [Agromyces seonyuensis]|uniref:MarR family transcriptional regulator n=1 Tax=Agromyces seonyuensis TaxID=2662446 RepID=A0A6I4P3Y4_9MICO|nr:MarR family transcriptional regulator [Agromyces seonyuensis]MWB97974.1 MarR family transcriptional regulator [Agromyces seonyuensis]